MKILLNYLEIRNRKPGGGAKFSENFPTTWPPQAPLATLEGHYFAKNCCDIVLGFVEWRATCQKRRTRLTRREAPHSSAMADAKRGDVIVTAR